MPKTRGKRAKQFSQLVNGLVDEVEPLVLHHGTQRQIRLFAWAVKTLVSQNRYRKEGYHKKAHDTISEENERLDKEGAPKRGRAKIMLKRNPELKNASKGDPIRYIRDRLRENNEK